MRVEARQVQGEARVADDGAVVDVFGEPRLSRIAGVADEQGVDRDRSPDQKDQRERDERAREDARVLRREQPVRARSRNRCEEQDGRHHETVVHVAGRNDECGEVGQHGETEPSRRSGLPVRERRDEHQAATPSGAECHAPPRGRGEVGDSGRRHRVHAVVGAGRANDGLHVCDEAGGVEKCVVSDEKRRSRRAGRERSVAKPPGAPGEVRGRQKVEAIRLVLGRDRQGGGHAETDEVTESTLPVRSNEQHEGEHHPERVRHVEVGRLRVVGQGQGGCRHEHGQPLGRGRPEQASEQAGKREAAHRHDEAHEPELDHQDVIGLYAGGDEVQALGHKGWGGREGEHRKVERRVLVVPAAGEPLAHGLSHGRRVDFVRSPTRSGETPGEAEAEDDKGREEHEPGRPISRERPRSDGQPEEPARRHRQCAKPGNGRDCDERRVHGRCLTRRRAAIPSRGTRRRRSSRTA